MLPRALILTVFISAQMLLPSSAVAGGASGSGGGAGVVGGSSANVGAQGPGGGGAVMEYVKARHEMGLDYALTNSEFLSQLESAAFKAALASNGVPKPVASIVLEVRRAFSLIDYAKQNKLDAEFVNKTVQAVLETAIIPAKVSVPGLSDALTLGKLTAAFTTAYGYGFFFGI